MYLSELRHDIQGLRAFAVLAVLFYHIAPTRLIGGFIGVDIFFVISGYLIIGKIDRQIRDGNFSFITFYNNRFSRLTPAYLLVISVTVLIAYLVMLPGEYFSFLKSAVATFFYVSNFWFYGDSGYFDTTLISSPLLHTWSLSVEEQFYLFIPIFLLLTAKLTNKTTVILWLTMLVSFIACVYMTRHNESLAFYMAPFRFWQFLLGAVVALSFSGFIISRVFREILVFLCIAILIGCCFFMSSDEFPGWKALLPTLATTIIIAVSRKGDLSYWSLGNPLAVYIGNISYSLYLWHWPIIVFIIMHVNSTPGWQYKLTIIALSFTLAILTYFFIEKPFRSKLKLKSIFKNYFGYGAFLSLFCIIIFSSYNLKINSISELRSKYASYLNYKLDNNMPSSCFITSSNNNFSYYDKKKCINYVYGEKNYLLLGDSHANHWYQAMKENFKDENLSEVAASGCKPLLNSSGAKRCIDMMEWVYDTHLKEVRYDKIFISARWVQSDADNLSKTLDKILPLAGEVVVMGPIVEYRVPLPRLLAKADTLDEVYDFSNYNAIKKTDMLIKKATGYSATYVSVLDAICRNKYDCELTSGAVPLQIDYGHLTLEGARKIIKNMKI